MTTVELLEKNLNMHDRLKNRPKVNLNYFKCVNF